MSIGDKSPEELIGDRSLALLDAVIALIVFAIFRWIIRKLSNATILNSVSLRIRLNVALFAFALLCSLGIYLGANVYVMLGASFLGVLLVVYWVLSDITRVGITNAFESTKNGISADASLRKVKKDVAFLGIGANKLTSSPEFDKMLNRVKATGGNLKFLLSDPYNQALEDLAKQNDRDNLSYRSRVKQSIREIHARASKAGVNYEIRLYDLEQKVALPHFRLMFIDDKVCLFSQVVWSKNEGLDNPQLIFTKNDSSSGSSLYHGYRSYFDDLWNLSSTKIVDRSLIEGWPA